MLRNLASLNTCCFNDLSNKLPIADSTVAQHIKALKDSGLIQGSLEPPKVKYCINKENWKLARSLLRDFIGIKIKKII